MGILIADSGSTKTEWCYISGGRKQFIATQGASPYFLNELQLTEMFKGELKSQLGKKMPDNVFFYGTGCAAVENRAMIKRAIIKVFPDANIEINHDLTGAARALCGREQGIVAILGTGSNSGFYNGKKILKNSPGLGYVLGDEGSGTHLGKKVLQYYLYKTFDDVLHKKFINKYQLKSSEILDAVYKKPLPNRYIANFTKFLAENRGHFMVENIIEDCFQDFLSIHIASYSKISKLPVHFTGSVGYGFQDVLKDLCRAYGWTTGKFLAKPMEGLIAYHQSAYGF